MISIHAPRAGRDSRPALPGGVVRAISIHAPRAGRDLTPENTPVYSKNFNPRAPCGARPASTAGTIGEVTFQSTRPVRGATKAFEGQHPTYEFQSTRPVRGATTLCSPR